MHVNDVHIAVCALLGTVVSRSSVKSCLAKPLRDRSWVVRHARGVYELDTDCPREVIHRAGRRVGRHMNLGVTTELIAGPLGARLQGCSAIVYSVVHG
jgi:hypothetical protein